MLKIKEGGFYRDRDGEKVGPMIPAGRGYRSEFKWRTEDQPSPWTDEGRFWDDDKESCRDLISEWNDLGENGPTRTRTVTEIVPGLYDHVKVNDPLQEPAKDGCAHVSMYGSLSADGLRAAARVLVSLAEALEENAE